MSWSWGQLLQQRKTLPKRLLGLLENRAKSADMENLNSLLKLWVWESGRKIDPATGVTPVARSIFRPLSQTHISKRELKNGQISRFCSVFQVIQVISSAKFFTAEEVYLSFNSERKEHPQISNTSFWKRDRENVFLQKFSGRNESTPKHQIMSVGYQVKQISKSRSWTHV